MSYIFVLVGHLFPGKNFRVTKKSFIVCLVFEQRGDMSGPRADRMKAVQVFHTCTCQCFIETNQTFRVVKMI
jgi:hypothetical protein